MVEIVLSHLRQPVLGQQELHQFLLKMHRLVRWQDCAMIEGLIGLADCNLLHGYFYQPNDSRIRQPRLALLKFRKVDWLNLLVLPSLLRVFSI